MLYYLDKIYIDKSQDGHICVNENKMRLVQERKKNPNCRQIYTKWDS